MFLEKLEESARLACRLEKEKLTLVGLSGGADSLALLDGLHRLGYSLAAAHFDHGLRPDSVQDAAAAARMAEERGIPFFCEKGDVRRLAAVERLSLEEAARKLRYQFLFRQARSLQAQAVAVGHTADDQCETVLMHFLRGSGPAGLRGMAARAVLPEWDAGIPLVRPALAAWRAETVGYCSDRAFQPRQDPTNLDTTYHRNRLRLEVIPYLAGFNPSIKEALIQLAEISAGEDTLLEELAGEAWKRIFEAEGVVGGSLDLAEFNRLPAGLQRRLARQAVNRLVPGLRDFDFQAVERIRRFASMAHNGQQLQLPGGIRLERERQRLLIHRAGEEPPLHSWLQLHQAEASTLDVPGRLALAGGCSLAAELVDPAPDPAHVHSAGQNEAWLDAAALSPPLVVRGLQLGDRIQPLGMQPGSIKIGDLFTNLKIPRRLRLRWPLVLSGSQCVWVAGLRVAHPARITPQTRQAVHLWIECCVEGTFPSN